MTRPDSPLPRRWLAELPLLLGLLAAWLRLWWAGRAFVLDQRIAGYSWPEYLGNAWMVVHGEDAGYDVFRRPLPALPQGLLGELAGSYPDGALLLSGLCLAAAVLGAGLLGRALAGPWAGGAAALGLTLAGPALDAARWGNHYPLQVAGLGLALGGGAACVRWPRASLALLSGLGVAMALSLDSRGLAALAPALGLVLLAAAWAEGSARRLGLPLAFGLGVALAPAGDALVWHPRRKLPPAEARLEVQQAAVARWIREVRDPGLDASCGSLPEASLLSREAATSPCGRDLRAHNRARTLPRHLPFGWPATLVGLGLALLPGTGGPRASLTSLLALGGGLGSLLLLASWAPLPERYLLFWAVPLAVAAPAGLARLVATLGRLPGSRPGLRRALQAGAILALLAWAWQTDPAQRTSTSRTERNPRYQLRLDAATAVRDVLGDGDRFRDCTELAVAVQLLPHVYEAGPPTLRHAGPESCREWLAGPELGSGSTFVLTEARRTGRGPREVDVLEGVHAAAEASGRWQEAWRSGGVVLWRWGENTSGDAGPP